MIPTEASIRGKRLMVVALLIVAAACSQADVPGQESLLPSEEVDEKVIGDQNSRANEIGTHSSHDVPPPGPVHACLLIAGGSGDLERPLNCSLEIE